MIFSTIGYAAQSFPCTLNAVDRTVTICAPPAAVSESPIRVVAGTRHSLTVKLMQIYVDGKKAFEVASDQLDMNLLLSVGTHSVTVQALDVQGFYSKNIKVTISRAFLPRFAYSAATDGTISGYTLRSDTGQPRADGYVVASHASVDAAVSWGRYLYVSNGAAGTVSTFGMSPAGRLSELAGSPFRCGTDCRGVAVDPSGKFLYVTDFGADLVRTFKIDPNSGLLGVLSDFGSIATGSQPNSLFVDPGGRFLYTTNYGDGSISGYSIIEGTGILTELGGSPFKAGANPTALAIDRSARFVVASNEGSNSVSMYLLDPSSGALRNATGSPVGLANRPGGVPIYPTGAFVYVAHPGANKVSAYKVQFSTKALTWVATYSAGSTPESLSVDAQGKFLYVAHRGVPAELWTFRIDPTTGQLSLAYKNRTRGAGVALAVSKGTSAVTYTPKFLYIGSVNQDSLAGSVAGFAIGAGGVLTRMPASPFAHPSGVVALATHPSGRFLYAPGRQLNYFAEVMVQYFINTTSGALTVGQVQQWGEPLSTRSIAVDTSGRFAYSPSSGDNEPVLWGWSVDQTTGALGGWLFYGVGGARYEAVALDPTGKFAYFMGGDGPQVSTIDPHDGNFSAGYGMRLRPFRNTVSDGSGRWVIGIDETNNVVASHSVNGSTGMLTEVSAVATGITPYAVTIDPYSRFVFVANNRSGDVSVYTLNGNTGALKQASGSPFPAGLNPVAVTVDDSGRYLYVANAGTRDVSAYVINGTTGGLTPIQSSRVATGANGPLTSISTVGGVK